MTLSKYLDEHRADARSWPGGETTRQVLVNFSRGLDLGAASGDVVLNCYAVLRDIVADEKARPVLRADARRYLAALRRDLRERYGLDPDGPR